MAKRYNNRDISWLYFNGRVLEEAMNPAVPLLERLKFLAIYSSNLDEFYRVRMPVLMALKELRKQKTLTDASLTKKNTLKTAKKIIQQQQEHFGLILSQHLIPGLRKQGIQLVYNEPIPEVLKKHIEAYFFHTIAGHIELIYPQKDRFFPQNNQLYLAVDLAESPYAMALLPIPSDAISRFFHITIANQQYVVLIDDIIREHIHRIFPNAISVHSFKITRDAELNLEDEFSGDVAAEIERLLVQRDYGLATRFLYQPTMPKEMRDNLIQILQLNHANRMKGGFYHNLKDFFGFPVREKQELYPAMPPIEIELSAPSLFEEIQNRDLLVHTPYQSYHPILRFFNEAVLHPDVEAIFITLYRIAPNSQIAQALISAAKNGKQVTVFMELKARFDEANNIRWSRKMKAAGVSIVYSAPSLKVHAKIALLTFRQDSQHPPLALFSTGNFNENTASTYTDHSLLTARPEFTKELRALFSYLTGELVLQALPSFKHLLVAKFNLLDAFIRLIDQEIQYAKAGKEARVVIKLNNLEEEKLINKLYEAGQAGVDIHLIVRSICRIRPQVKGLSERIHVTRIVDRFLEHGRIFLFHQDGEQKLFMGSSDWMNRNIYRRIEVCFPIEDPQLKEEILQLVQLHLQDDLAGVSVGEHGQNIPITPKHFIRSQSEIYRLLQGVRTNPAPLKQESNFTVDATKIEKA